MPNENFLRQEQAKNLADPLKFSGRCFLISDILSLVIAFICGGLLSGFISIYLRGGFMPLWSELAFTHVVTFMVMGTLALLWLNSRGHYRQRLPYWETNGHVLAIAFIGFLLCGFVQFLAQKGFSRLWLGFSWLFFAMFLFAGRSLVRRWLEKRGEWHIPALIIGNGPSSTAVLRALRREPRMGFQIVGRLSSDEVAGLIQPGAWRECLAHHNAAYLFLALEGSELEARQDALKAMARERVPCSIVPPWLGLPSSTLSPHHFMMHDVLLLHDTNRLYLPISSFIKRSFDIAVAGTALLFLSPIFLIVAFLIKRDGGPAFFKQYRVGRNGEVFYCYKFRSMRVDAEEFLEQYLAENPEAAAEWQKYQKLKKDIRITKVGDLIRRTSVDELPQLINVMKGDMSLVGPRPIMPGQEEYYKEDFVYYENVRPGLTGPWQVSGRNQLTFKERVVLESYYSKNWSLWMDIVILMKTIPAVLSKEQAF